MTTKKIDWTPVKKDEKGMPFYEVMPRATPPKKGGKK